MQLILGSQSPRRKEILSFFDIPFSQVTSSFDEDSIVFDGNPGNYVKNISKGKASALHRFFPENTLLTADTTVYCDGKIYNKPQNEEHAMESLTELAGRWHSVYTGVTLRRGHQILSQFEESKVLFNPLSPHQIRKYLSKLPWGDKAGGYSIQLGGALIVRKIDGCFYNVMGLPINTLRELFIQLGVDLFEHVYS